MNKFIKVKTDNHSGYVTNEVSSVMPYEANTSEENRIKFVTDLAAISRGKHESNNPAVRFKALLKEASPSELTLSNEETKGSPSRPIEFLGIVLGYKLVGNEIVLMQTNADMLLDHKHYKFDFELFNNLIGRYSIIKDNLIYTNLRTLLNAGIPYEAIPYNTEEELKDFKAFRLNVPMFVFNHLITHTAISKEARSERVVDISNIDYWLPEDFSERWKASNVPDPIVISTMEHSGQVFKLLRDYTQRDIQELFKDLGYKKEIYQRAMLEFRYKEMVMVGWNTFNTFAHLIIERNGAPDIWKSWTQKETNDVINALAEVLEFSNKEQ